MNLISVRLSTLKPGMIIPFDLFIRVGSSHLHYLRAGDDLDQDRFDTMVKKGAKRLYIEADKEELYHRYLDDQLAKINPDPIEAKTSLAREASDQSADSVISSPGVIKSYQMAQSSTEILKRVLSGNSQMLKDLVLQEKFTNATLTQKMKRHMINTASIAIKFAQHFSSDIDLNKLGVAAFYHDVSFTQYSPMDQLLFFKELSSMTPEQLTTYKTHPQKSAMLLQDKGFAEREVIDLIMTHEEKISGNGFPGKLTKLSPAQQVLSLSAFYDREITCLEKAAPAVQADLMISQLGNYELSLLKSFATFVKGNL
jgi:HD-GYP domain-containing protein (c-di-GMP phosphodiesterase class II)